MSTFPYGAEIMNYFLDHGLADKTNPVDFMLGFVAAATIMYHHPEYMMALSTAFHEFDSRSEGWAERFPQMVPISEVA